MKPGIYEELPADKYYGLDMVSSSMLQAFRQLPVLATVEKEETPAMLTGKEIHQAILENNLNIKPANKERFYALNREICSGRCEIVRKLIQAGSKEVSLIWHDPDTDQMCKARLDLLVDELGIVADIKTTTNVDPNGWLKTALNSGAYPHYQAHWYLKGAQALGLKVHSFCWILMQTRAPWSITVAQASPEMIYAAELGINELLPQIAECRRTGNWPGYPDEITTLDLPAWFLKREEL